MNSILEILNGNYAVRAFGISLLHSLWQGAGIALLLWLVLKATSHLSAKARYSLALLAVCALIVCFAYTLSLYLTIAEPAYVQNKAQTLLVITSGQEEATVTEQNLTLHLQAQWNQLMNWLQLHVSYFLLAWFAGFLFCTFRFTSGLFYLRSIKQQSTLLPVCWLTKMKTLQQKLGLRTKVSLVSSDKVNSPFTFGWLKPVIVVPASMLTLLPADQIESILLHELAHIRRHDYLINLLQNIAELFFFFNPGYWYIAQVLETEREHVCDDLVVKHTSNYRTYALALANLAQFPVLEQNRLVMAVAAKENSLLLRIKRIIHTSTSTNMMHNTTRRKSYQVTTLLIACFLFAFLAIDVNGKQVKPGATEKVPVADEATGQLAVTGVVLSKGGKALSGVAIIIKNTAKGTVTSSDGKYTISAEPSDTLIYRFTGFEKKQLAATDKETQRVVLYEGSKPEVTRTVTEVQVEGRPLEGSVQEKVVREIQVEGRGEMLGNSEKVHKVVTEVEAEGRPLDATAVTVKGSPSVNARVVTVSGGKSESQVKAISIQPASGDATKQPAYYIYESNVLKGLQSGTAAFAQAATKGTRITDLQDIDPASIQAIHVLKDKLAVSAFGDAAKNGAVLITLQENTFKPVVAEKAEEFIVYPVPADRFVKIRFYLNKKQHVKADAIDFNGAKVKTLTNQVLESGWHEFEWDASKNPAGTYILILNKETGVVNKKVLLK